MMTRRVPASATVLMSLCLSSIAWGDDASPDNAPPPPPQHQWIGKGQFGFLQSKGNSDAESINALIDLSRNDDAWKNALHVGGLYGKSAGIDAAQRLEVREQTDYAFDERLFAFGGLRYEHDLFDGFLYQASFTTGLGYNVIDSNDDKLTVQAGPGYRRLRPEIITKDADGIVTSRVPQNASGEAIVAVGIDYMRKFTPTTTLTNKLLVQYGADDTLAHDELALAVKISTKLALSVGYAITENSKPPAPLKKVDTLSTVNLVFSF